jgi:iron complex outermembrane recepter protein
LRIHSTRVGSQLGKNFNITLDGYFIGIKDRVLLSSRLTKLDPALQSVSFFINGINTDTYGLDLVTQYKNIQALGGKITINAAANYNQTKIKGQTATPAPVLAANPQAVMFNRTEASLITSSRPSYKAVFGLDYSYHNFGLGLNNTLFGPAKFASTGLPNNDMAYNDNTQQATYLRFKPRVLTDLNLSYKLNQNHSLNLNVSNIFNLTPKWELENVSEADEKAVSNAATFNGRYPQSGYDSQHFSIFGTQFMLGYNFKF